MNIYSILENRLEELPVVTEHISKNDYEKLYNKYSDVVEYLLFLETREEFFDFLNEQKEIKEESFLLALAYKKKLCCSFGIYEENIGLILQEYIQENSHICVEFNGLDDNIDLLVDSINKVNVEDPLHKYIILLDDTYSEGCFYIFCVSTDESEEEWDSIYIKRLL